MSSRERLLAAALLWLRNHYETGDPLEREKVLQRVDNILKDQGPITLADMKTLRKQYPS